MQIKTDAVIIGSGAAGSVMAYQLARRGLKVVILERGWRQDPVTFEHDEVAMFPRVYKSGGLQTSADHNLVIAQGATVGGSTVINNAIWLRSDLDRILPDWQERGADVSRESIEAAWTELESALHVTPLPPDLANVGTGLFLDGCRALGIPARYLNNNRSGCLGCGWCNYGCRYNRKTSMLVTYIPWAEGRGAIFLDGCQDVQVRTAGTRAIGAVCARDGETVEVSAERVVVCAGAIGSSEVLLRSGIHRNGLTGSGLHVLGGIFVTADCTRRIDGFDGIGLTAVAQVSPDFVIESYFAPPVVFSLSLGGWFASHYNRMMRYGYFADAGVMVATDPTGNVTLDKNGSVRIDLTFSARDLGRLTAGIQQLGQIFFAGGATRVLPATFKQLEFSSPRELNDLPAMVRRPDDLLLGSAHPQGGNPISEDPNRGVVGNDFHVHGYENLFVADASVFPSNIWANCQATVMAISRVASDSVAA